MGSGLVFHGEGFDAFGMVLDRFSHRLRDPVPVWEQIADRFVDLQAANFANQGKTMSNGWSPLSANYGRWKARHYPGRGILVRSGELRESLAEKLGIREMNKQSMTVGTQLPHARFHQYGTSNMPARPLIGKVPIQEQREWAKILQRHLVEGL